MAALTTTRLKARMDAMRGPVVDTVHDFTTMTSAQVLAAYPLASFGSDSYVPQADGSYVLRAAGQAPVTDKGVVVDGVFVNYVRNGALAGAIAGTPGTFPTSWSSTFLHPSSIELVTVLGVPGVKFAGIPVEGLTAIYQYGTGIGAYSARSGLFKSTMSPQNAAWYNNIAVSPGLDGNDNYRCVVAPHDDYNKYYDIRFASSSGDFSIAGPQLVDLPFCPSTLALSSGTTTAKLADIIQREVDLRGPFAVEIVATTAPGDPGLAQQIFCLSKDANTRINVARDPSTNLVKVESKANGSSVATTGTVVAHNTQTVVRMQVEFNGCRVSVAGSAAVNISKARADTYILNTLGTDYNGTGSFWGSIQSFRILENYIATDDELENGFAL